jgi:DGQHR domain-containing protein
MENNNYIKSNFIKISQPLGDFFIGKMRFEDLLKIAFADVRRIEKDEQTGYESYFGIQRKLSEKRVKEISEYVTTLDATFPSSILLAIDEYSIDLNTLQVSDDANIIFNEKNNCLEIKDEENIAHIIDGQHRVFGLKKALDKGGLFSQKIKDFELVVTIFVNMDDENQALVFSTINKAHTKVNNSLVYDLFDLAKTRSPQRTVHNIVKLLNEREESPFKDKIKMLGFAEDTSRETIAQATLAELVLGYISKNAMLDRDYLKRGKSLEKYSGNDLKKYFLREWFINEEDAKIARLVWNYFKVVEEKWEIAWKDSTKILAKSTGIISLMRFLRDIVIHLDSVNRIITIEEFKEIFSKITIKDIELTNEEFKAGGVGQAKLYKRLKQEAEI